MQELIQSNNAEIFELIQVLKMMPNLDQIKLGSIHLDSWYIFETLGLDKYNKNNMAIN